MLRVCWFMKLGDSWILKGPYKMFELPFRIGLFYGSTTCYTEIAAEKIAEFFGRDAEQKPWVELHNIAKTELRPMADYQGLILGIPTWDYGELQEDWDRLWDQLDEIDFNNKVVSIYGLGDQIGYPDWFQDAVGYLYNKVDERGATMIGLWPSKGYQYNSSQALTNDQQHFLGLALDDESEFELSEDRIHQWCTQLAREFTLAANKNNQ